MKSVIIIHKNDTLQSTNGRDTLNCIIYELKIEKVLSDKGD